MPGDVCQLTEDLFTLYAMSLLCPILSQWQARF